MLDEQAECQSVPKISKYASKLENRTPIHERVTEPEDFDQTLRQKRELRPRNMDDEDEESFSFEPQLVSERKEYGKRRTVDDLLQWGSEKRNKLASRRMSKLEGSTYTFKPEIDSRSKKLTNRRGGGEKVEDRLMNAGIQRDNKISELQTEKEKGMFKPDINQNSKKLLKKKGDRLKKISNGSKFNVDYFTAVPLEEIDQNGLAKSMKKRKSKSRSRLLKKKTSQKRARKKDSSSRGVSMSKARNEDMLKNYVSPYQKDTLASGLPLKSKENRQIKKKKIKNRGKKLRYKRRLDNRSKSRKNSRSKSRASPKKTLGI